MNGGFGRRTSDAKVRILERKSVYSIFAKGLGLGFCEKNGHIYRRWPVPFGEKVAGPF